MFTRREPVNDFITIICITLLYRVYSIQCDYNVANYVKIHDIRGRSNILKYTVKKIKYAD